MSPLPLVMLPGTLCDERVFAPLEDRLPGRHCDIRRTTGQRSTPDMARALLRTLPPRFALAGFSLGGIVALEMIAQAPDRVTGLALLDTTPMPDPHSNRAPRRSAAARAAQAGIAAYAGGELWQVSVAEASRGAEDNRALIVSMAGAIGLDGFGDQIEMAIHRADSRPRLGRISVPTLVLCGAADQLCTVETHREMAAAIPGARFAIVPDAGHFALIERPDAVAAELRVWLARIDAQLPKETVHESRA